MNAITRTKLQQTSTAGSSSGSEEPLRGLHIILSVPPNPRPEAPLNAFADDQRTLQQIFPGTETRKSLSATVIFPSLGQSILVFVIRETGLTLLALGAPGVTVSKYGVTIGKFTDRAIGQETVGEFIEMVNLYRGTADSIQSGRRHTLSRN